MRLKLEVECHGPVPWCKSPLLFPVADLNRCFEPRKQDKLKGELHPGIKVRPQPRSPSGFGVLLLPCHIWLPGYPYPPGYQPRMVTGRQEPSEKVPRLRQINSNSPHDEFRPGSTVTAFAEMNSLSPLKSQADQSCCTPPAGEETETPSLCPGCPVT